MRISIVDSIHYLEAAHGTPIALPQPGKPRKFNVPSALSFDKNTALTAVDGSSIELPDA
jgi:hypothetical protein